MIRVTLPRLDHQDRQAEDVVADASIQEPGHSR